MDSNFVIEYLGEIEAEFENTLVSSLFIGGQDGFESRRKKEVEKLVQIASNLTQRFKFDLALDYLLVVLLRFSLMILLFLTNKNV